MENNLTDQIYETITKNFVESVSQLINEIDVSFDNIPDKLRSGLQKYNKKIKNVNTRLAEISNIINDLKPFEQLINEVVNTSGKIQSAKIKFLNNVVLFNGLLHFDIFEQENKATKIALIKYLHTIYLTANIGFIDADKLDETWAQNLATYIDSIKQQSSKQITIPKNDKNKNDSYDLFSSLMSNPEILNMAQELTNDLESQKVDPMSLLGSLMSGKQDPKLTKLVSNITSKIETKISNGEINKTELEEQAGSFVQNLETNPMFKDLLHNFKK